MVISKPFVIGDMSSLICISRALAEFANLHVHACTEGERPSLVERKSLYFGARSG